MEVAHCRVKVSKYSDVPRFTITPAELLVLKKAYEEAANGDPISGVEIVGSSNITNREEIARLSSFYKDLKHKGAGDAMLYTVVTLFPGENPVLPQTFAEIGINAPIATSTGPQNYAPDLIGKEQLKTQKLVVQPTEGLKPFGATKKTYEKVDVEAPATQAEVAPNIQAHETPAPKQVIRK